MPQRSKKKKKKSKQNENENTGTDFLRRSLKSGVVVRPSEGYSHSVHFRRKHRTRWVDVNIWRWFPTRLSGATVAFKTYFPFQTEGIQQRWRHFLWFFFFYDSMTKSKVENIAAVLTMSRDCKRTLKSFLMFWCRDIEAELPAARCQSSNRVGTSWLSVRTSALFKATSAACE